MNDHVGSADLELTLVYKIMGTELGVLAELIVEAFSEGFGVSLGNSAFIQYARYLGFGNGERILGSCFLVYLDALADAVVHRLHQLVVAFIPERFGQQTAEGLLLLVGGAGHIRAEHGFEKGVLIYTGGLCVIQRVVYVGTAVVKGGEHKAQLRGGYHPVYLAAVEFVGVAAVTEGGFCHFYGAYGADYVGKALGGAVAVAAAVLAAPRDVIGVVGEKYEEIALKINAAHRSGEKFLDKSLVIRCGAAQSHQSAVLLGTVHDLTGGKGHVQQILPGSAGKNALEKSEICLGLLFGDDAQRLAEA